MRTTLRRTLALAGGTLAIAGLMAAYSYTTASVNNPSMALSVTNTSQALLAIGSGNGVGNDGVARDSATIYNSNNWSNGQLIFDFDATYTRGAQSGVQPSSTYTWDSLFKVTNNSNNQVQVQVSSTNTSAQTLLFAVDGSGLDMTQPLTFTLDKGATKEIDVQVTGNTLTNNGNPLGQGANFGIVVKGTAQ